MHTKNTRLPLALSLALAAATAALPGAAGATGLGSNLVANGTAENGTSNWSSFGGVDLFSAVEYGPNWVLPSDPGPADRGNWLFAGGPGVAYGAAWQNADLGGISAADLAHGRLGYSVSGWLGGWLAQTDSASFTVQFLDGSSNVLGNVVLGPSTPADRANATGLFLYTASGQVPVATTSIRFVLEMTRTSGGDNDGYADNLSFTLSPVPEPASAALLLAGLLGLGLRASRRSQPARGRRA